MTLSATSCKKPGRGLIGLLLVFLPVSLVAWLILRPLMGVREGQTKTWDRDINED